MAMDINGVRARCYRCGTEYGRYKGYFPVSYAILHKGLGFIPVCKTCIDDMYNGYLSQCNDAKLAVRQMCRKLDLYWSSAVYEIVSRKSTTRSMMTQYIAKINTLTYVGKSYDDTLSEEGSLWAFSENPVLTETPERQAPTEEEQDLSDIPEETISFWGTGYSREMYDVLENKFSYYKSNIPQETFDLGTERLIRQICILEVGIDRDNAAGKSVEKSVNAYNTLIGSLNLKPIQKKDDGDSNLYNTPFGVWINKWENERPIPEPDPELQDVDKIKKYICVWFFGHLCKMLNIKNSYSKLYEEEIEKIKVKRPEYEGEDDEEIIYDEFKDNDDNEDDER